MTDQSTYNGYKWLSEVKLPSVIIVLKKVNAHEWAMFAPKGHQLGPKYRGDGYKAKLWAEAWVSTWPGWIIDQQGEESE